jgi:hypothetical protein
VVASVPRDGDIDFQVVRGGDSPMGEHRLTFRQSDEGMQVDVSIDLDVDFGPFTVYEYEHSNREVWQNGQLVSLTSETNDNGDDYFVRAERTNDGLRVESQDGVKTVPADILPTSYWNYDIVEADRVLDTQKGRVMEIETRRVGEAEIWVDGRRVPARHYRMTGDIKLDLWYDADNQWVKTAFVVRDEQIEYFRGGLPEDLEQASFFVGPKASGGADRENGLLEIQRSAR